MRRAVVISLVLLLSVTILSAVGCGGSGDSGGTSQYQQMKAQAEELFATADADWTALKTKIDEANNNTEQLILKAMGGNAAAIPPEQRTGLSASTRALITEADSVRTEFEALDKPEFKQLKGVDVYASYAEAMIKAIDAYKQLLELGANFLAKIEPALASGDAAAISAAIQQNMADVTQIQAAQTNAETALAEAEKIKDAERLGAK